MLDLKKLQEQLRLNERLTKLELCKINGPNIKRLCELQLHRSLIKDCIMEILGNRRAA